MPQYPVALAADGITKGRAVLAISIDETGRVRDSLPLAYTDARFARTAQEVLADWRFAPARIDGEPVPVQLEVSFDFKLEGAVITANIANHFVFDGFDHAGPNALVYQPGRLARLDATPVRVGGDDPRYAQAAKKDGVRGPVTVRFYIDEQGTVRLPAVITATNPYLMDQAVAAVRTWKFKPVTQRGEPVLVVAEQQFHFGGR